MNKSLKAKNLPLFSIIDLDQLRRGNLVKRFSGNSI